MKKTYLIILAGLIFIATVTLSLRPVTVAAEQDCQSLTGTVTEIYEGGIRDVVFKLQGKKQTYYINRGLARGLVLNDLQNRLIGREIVIKYPEHWTLLDPNRTVVHVSKIEHGSQILFSELN